jgi:hypothetical protein
VFELLDELMVIVNTPSGLAPLKSMGIGMLVCPAVNSTLVKPPPKLVPVTKKLVVLFAVIPDNVKVMLPDCVVLLALKTPSITAEVHVNVKGVAGGGGKTLTDRAQVPKAEFELMVKGIVPPVPVPL